MNVYCAETILYFTEDEEFARPIIGKQVYSYPILKYGMYKGPDTELLNYYGSSASTKRGLIFYRKFLIILLVDNIGILCYAIMFK